VNKTPDEQADYILKVAADPARFAAEASRAPETLFTSTLSGCTSIDERIVMFSRVYGNDALPAFIRVCGWDKTRLTQAAADLDRNRMSELAKLVRATIPTVKAKTSVAVTTKRKAKAASRRAYLKAMAKARRPCKN
jgi:hypothetical protein